MAGEPASSHPTAIRAHDGAISHPRWDTVYVDHLRDLVLQTSDGARGKRVGRKKKEIEMAIGRYDFSIHANSLDDADEFGLCHITAIGSGPASNFSSVGPAGIKEGLVERRQKRERARC
jgi:hypothetical protein